MISLLLVGLGGAVGALFRFGIGQAVQSIWTHSVLTSTLMINIIGSILMGVLYSLVSHFVEWHEGIKLSFMVGLLGSFTTFSTFSLEVILLIEEKAWLMAAAYTGASVCLSVGGLYLALMVTRGLLA